MVVAFFLILVVTVVGAFVFGLILQYFTRNVIKSAVLSGLIALTITAMQSQQEYTRTFYHLLFTLLSKYSIYSYVILFFSGIIGAMISRHFLKKEGIWQQWDNDNQGLVIGFVFGFMSFAWFNIINNFFISLTFFSIVGYLLGRFLVGQTINKYKLTFFNIFLIFVIIIGSAHAMKFETVKKERQNFFDEHFYEDAPIGPSNLPIDTVSSFGGKIDFEKQIPIQFSVSEKGTNYTRIENLYSVANKYIKTLPALSDVQVINDRRLRYNYKGKRYDVFFSGVVLHPKKDYTYITVKYIYNVKISEKTQRTIEFLRTHINSQYLPTDLESHIIESYSKIPESTYLRGEEYPFVGKQYTRFDKKDNIIFVFEMWRENASINEQEAYQLAKSIIKTMPEYNVSFNESIIEHEFDRLNGPEKTTQFKTMYSYNGEEYEIRILSRYTEHHVGWKGGYYPTIYLKEL